MRVVEEKDESVHVTPDEVDGPRTLLTTVYCRRTGWEVWSTLADGFTVTSDRMTRDEACVAAGIGEDDRQVQSALDRLVRRQQLKLQCL